MNVVRWQCNLQPSRWARVLNVALFLFCAGILLSLSWPASWSWGQIPAVLLLLLECRRNDHRLMQRRGCMVLEPQGDWLWEGVRWQSTRKADWLPIGVLLSLRNPQGKRWRLWLMHDNMPPGAWRALRANCFLRERETEL